MARARLAAVVFDLDGTLIDSIPDVVGALNRLLAEEGRRAVAWAEARAMVGDGAGAMVRRAFAATGETAPEDALPALTARYIDIYRRYPVVETVAYPGVPEVLTRLRAEGMALGICTNKPHEMSMLVLETMGLAAHFEAVLGGDALAVKKPDPGHLDAVLDRLGATRAGAVYVGDSPVDVAAARNAALPVIAVTYGYSRVPPASLGADLLIDRFDELPGALARLARVP
jgi:phosphoglycolate phosphatase